MHYTQADLEHNRSGKLSPAQKADLQRGWHRARWLGIVLVSVMVVVGIVFYLSGDLAGWIATWIFALVVGLWLVVLWRKVQRLEREGVVASLTGAVQRETVRDEGSDRHFLRVGEHRLMLHEEDYAGFLDGEVVTVYYVPMTGYVVSREAG